MVVIILSPIVAVLSFFGAVYSYMFCQSITFRNGKGYLTDEFGDRVRRINHPRRKLAAHVLLFVASAVGLLGSSFLFLDRIGVPIVLIEKAASLFTLLLVGVMCYRVAGRKRSIGCMKSRFAEVYRQSMYVMGLFGKGGAWIMLVFILADFSGALAITCTVAALFWAVMQFRKAN